MEYLIGKKIKFKWNERIIVGEDMASYYEDIVHEEKGVVQQFLLNNQNELLILVLTEKFKLKSILAEKIYELKTIDGNSLNIEIQENKFKMLDIE